MIKHNFKKEYGQNFLVSNNFAEELVNALDLQENDTVIEIGPGDGMITNIILNKGLKRLIAVEIDYDLLPNLIKRFSSFDTFKLVHRDILGVDLNEFFSENQISGDVKIIGALPYNISKKIIDLFLNFTQKNFEENRTEIKISKMAFIVQEEVAKDYIAKAPQSSFLSNYLQLFADSRKLKSIPAHKFYPMPRVNGAILQISLKDELPNNYVELKKFIRLGFSSPRKTLARNLQNLPEYKDLDFPAIFQKIGIGEKARPAELTLEMLKELFELANS